MLEPISNKIKPSRGFHVVLASRKTGVTSNDASIGRGKILNGYGDVVGHPILDLDGFRVRSNSGIWIKGVVFICMKNEPAASATFVINIIVVGDAFSVGQRHQKTKVQFSVVNTIRLFVDEVYLSLFAVPHMNRVAFVGATNCEHSDT